LNGRVATAQILVDSGAILTALDDDGRQATQAAAFAQVRVVLYRIVSYCIYSVSMLCATLFTFANTISFFFLSPVQTTGQQKGEWERVVKLIEKTIALRDAMGAVDNGGNDQSNAITEWI
jgi:hypothetical protein